MPERGSLRITLPYFAFLRGLVQGLGARALWERYLSHRGDFDARSCRSLVRQLQRELGAVARRQGRPEVAAVLRQAGVFSLLKEAAPLDPRGLASSSVPGPAEPPSSFISASPASSSVGTGAPEAPHRPPEGEGPAKRGASQAAEGSNTQGLPTFDEIRARFDADVFSEAELLELWREEVQAQRKHAPSSAPPGAPGAEAGPAASGGASPAPSQLAVARRARRMMQRLEVLSWLERLHGEPPQPSDPVDAWLEPLLCARLEAAGVFTFQGLFDLAGRIGFNWHAAVPRLGALGAHSLVSWLQSHEGSLGPFPAHALVKQSELDLDVKESANKGVMLPWESLGKEGAGADLLRSCGALEDYLCAEAWLESVRESPNTFRAYRRETERLFLWCLLTKGKAPSQVGGEVPLAYLDFLAAPPPAWCAPRRTPRWSPAWRPLEGPLSGASIRVARQVATSLFSALSGSGR